MCMTLQDNFGSTNKTQCLRCTKTFTSGENHSIYLFRLEFIVFHGTVYLLL